MPALSGVVITYNRVDVVQTCLSGARLVCDELVVVDKGSTDGTAEIGERIADKFAQVPWSPIVEGTRVEATAMASHDWILSLDDDECLNGAALEFICAHMKSPVASIYYLPQKHYILGRHDHRAYYWPELKSCLFRRDAMAFSSRVHAGFQPLAADTYRVNSDAGPAIEHLSHKDVSTYIEKTNRYTSMSERVGVPNIEPRRLIEIMRYHLAKAGDNGGYLSAVSALRGIYDVVDAIKLWEAQNCGDGGKSFQAICDSLAEQYREFLAVA